MIYTDNCSRPVVGRFCDAMIQIRKEAEDIIAGKQPKDNNVLKNAPHPISVIALSEEEWNRCVYSESTLVGIILSDVFAAHIPARLLRTPCLGFWRRNSGLLFPASMTVSLRAHDPIFCY